MTSYTSLPNAAVQAGGRPRGSTITALRDNPLAIAEGDPTAPVNQAMWHPHNKVTVGDANDGKFYDFAVDGAVASRVSPDLANGYEYRIRGNLLSHNSGTAQSLQMEVFREGAGVYSNAAAINTAAANTFFWGFDAVFPMARWQSNSNFIDVRSYVQSTYPNQLVAAAPATLVLATQSAGERILRVRISFSAGSIDSGQLYLDRRRVVF